MESLKRYNDDEDSDETPCRNPLTNVPQSVSLSTSTSAASSSTSASTSTAAFKKPIPWQRLRLIQPDEADFARGQYVETCGEYGHAVHETVKSTFHRLDKSADTLRQKLASEWTKITESSRIQGVACSVTDATDAEIACHWETLIHKAEHQVAEDYADFNSEDDDPAEASSSHGDRKHTGATRSLPDLVQQSLMMREALTEAKSELVVAAERRKMLGGLRSFLNNN